MMDWDARAALGARAGTDDLIAKTLEQRELIVALGSPRTVLEVGCGTGETARLVAQWYRDATVTATDASQGMIAAAVTADRVRYLVRDVTVLPEGPFDAVYSQRCLINLLTWEAQEAALQAIADRLAPGGRYLMCECSQAGLDAINVARRDLGLSAIAAPGHNRYLREEELATVTCLRLLMSVPFSATYYYHSRVINAALAAREGHAPAYDAPVNQLALRLPMDCVDARFSQGRLWIWGRRHERQPAGIWSMP
jgi:ubiquinone/menaquinone biosynthesis C-methylase UbiE